MSAGQTGTQYPHMLHAGSPSANSLNVPAMGPPQGDAPTRARSSFASSSNFLRTPTANAIASFASDFVASFAALRASARDSFVVRATRSHASSRFTSRSNAYRAASQLGHRSGSSSLSVSEPHTEHS